MKPLRWWHFIAALAAYGAFLSTILLLEQIGLLQ